MDLEFFYSFGINSSFIRNVTFYDDKSLVFSAGKLCILLDLETRVQRIIQIIDGCEITAINRCKSHILVAAQGNPPFVCLFNIDSSTRKMFAGPTTIKSDRFICITISTSLKFVAAQGYDPDWALVIWSSNTREIVAVFNPTYGKLESFVHDISFHAGEREEIVVVGKNIFRLYEYQNEEEDEPGSFVEVIFEKYEEGEQYFSIAWPLKENLAVATLSGKILFFRGIDLVHEISVFATIKDKLNIDPFILNCSSSKLKGVTYLVCTPNNLVCIVAGCLVVVYEGMEINGYAFNRCVSLPVLKNREVFPGEALLHKNFITLIDFSLNGKVMCASTSNGQLFYLDMTKHDTTNQQFEVLFQRQHKSTIIAMDVARERPLVATCCEQLVILWNFETEKQEMIIRFKDTIHCLAIHPSGLYIALGFTFYTRICFIAYDKLKEYQRVNSKNCCKMSFSYGGHLLALSHNTAIEIYNFLTFERLAKFEGHAGRISSLVWKDEDTRLVSGDERGVICEWDLVSYCKLWENTAVTSYSCLVVLPNENNVIAVGSGKKLKCVSDGSVHWEYDCQNALNTMAVPANAKSLYTGASDGCLGRLLLPLPGDTFRMFAHKGEITVMKFSRNYGLLFTVSVDGLLLVWKTDMTVEDFTKGTICNTVFTSVSDLSKRNDSIELLRMSIKRCEMACEFDAKITRLKLEEMMKNMFVVHERLVKDLNKEIADLKEAIELVLFDSDMQKDLQEPVNLVRKIFLNQTEALSVAYGQTDEFIKETQEIGKNYESTLAEMEGVYTDSWTDGERKEDQLLREIKDLENSIMEEQNSSECARKAIREVESLKQEAMEEEERRLKALQEAEMEAEKLEIETLKVEIRKLGHMVKLTREDSLRKRKIASGQVDFDISEKLNVLKGLRKQYHDLEDKLKTKEKIALNQNAKYFEMRSVVGNLQRCHSVFKGTVERLKSNIKAIESEMESCQKEIENVNDSIPLVEEKIRLIGELSSTLDKKLTETVEGFRVKSSLLRDNQNILSKYKSLLHESLSQTCDSRELCKNILHLFDQVKSGVDESLDPNLKQEFAHQIETLQNTYQYVKADPSKVTREQSLAEFKLSQENSKLLKEVHEIQKEQESLRDTIFRMEVAMGMPHTRQAKITKEIDELRDKIELVVFTLSQKREDKQHEIEKLDELIEEQQREIHRLQLELTNKQQSGK